MLSGLESNLEQKACCGRWAGPNGNTSDFAVIGDGQPIGYAVSHTANRSCFRTGDLVRCPEVFGEMGAGCAETCTSGSTRARC